MGINNILFDDKRIICYVMVSITFEIQFNLIKYIIIVAIYTDCFEINERIIIIEHINNIEIAIKVYNEW